MSEYEGFTISISRSISDDYRNARFTEMKELAEVKALAGKRLGPGELWDVFVVIVKDVAPVAKDVGVIAGASVAVLNLAEKIVAWKEKLLQGGISRDVKLKRAGKEELDIFKATGDEVKQWFVDAPTTGSSS
jgi:hypothetical protein